MAAVNKWADLPFFASELADNVRSFLRDEVRSGKIIYPKHADRFRAFKLTPLRKVKVVLMGQDPYHGPGQANGLAFSVHADMPLPPSLSNIYEEMESDLGCRPPDGDLSYLARRGVLMLNASLTVVQSQPGSHSEVWGNLISDVVDQMAMRRVVFILWGRHAQRLVSRAGIDADRIVSSPHPSPYSAHSGFFGSRPFSQANKMLKAMGIRPVQWCKGAT